MNAPLTAPRARKGLAVYLQHDLPKGFGNSSPINKSPFLKGYIESEGFENGVVKVHFPLYQGDEHTAFSPDAAIKYLECDPFA